MMQWLPWSSVAGGLVAAVAAAVSLRRGYLRRHPRAAAPPDGFEPTAERFRDPTTGILQVVWFNPRTGERWYQPVTGGGAVARRQP